MSTDHIPEVRQMVPAVGAQPEPGVRPAEPEREAFERWVTDDGKWPQAALRTVGGGYSRMIAHTQWTAWRAASLAERERCAKLCEQEICNCCWGEDAQAAAEHLAEVIRGPNVGAKRPP